MQIFKITFQETEKSGQDAKCDKIIDINVLTLLKGVEGKGADLSNLRNNQRL